MRGRFAPSPTGRMHLGNARTALLAWLQARVAGGGIVLRIEDLDPARSRPELADGLKVDLEWLGLDWDGTPALQSQRSALYAEALRSLGSRVYPCWCTRAEIARAVAAPHEAEPVYPGTCRPPVQAERGRGRAPAYRFIPEAGATSFDDLVAGPQSQDVAHDVGDFVVWRNDGVAAYQLAVVVDDADQGITHVLRADDLLSSTARQIQLYRALGRPVPTFAHVPLLLGEDGKRLAKRDGPFAIADLRDAKVEPERVVGLLAGWSGLGSGEPIRPRELVQGFTLGQVRREPVMARRADIEARLDVRWP